MSKYTLKRNKHGVKRRTRYFEGTAWVLSFGLWAAGLWPLGVRNASRVHLVQIDIPIRDLPPQFEGYRILHLSDFHIDILPGVISTTIEAIKDIDCDIAVLTGDYQGYYGEGVGHLSEPFSKIIAALRARDGIVGIMGNHDCARMGDILSSLSVTMLINETVAIRRAGSEICLTGVDDVHHYWSPMAREAMLAAPADRIRIALVHTSELAPDASMLGYSLYLTGHTHGGQICWPGGAPVVTMGMPREFSAGVWTLGAMVGCTSRGVGVSCLPLRYNCSAEIALITLRAV